MIQLPDLPYPYEALEPVLSGRTMRVHHDKHHAKYVEVTNGLLANAPHPEGSLEDLIREAARAGEHKLFNNSAQAWNHGFFWACMTPRSTRPDGSLKDAVEAAGGEEALRGQFLAEGAGHFGSGWVWLVVQDGRLAVLSTHDADTVVTRDVTPLLVCDVWEHAYYLDHQNDRAAFLSLWWDRLADWRFAGEQFAAACGLGAVWRYPDDAAAHPPIREHGAFERALEEAGLLFEEPPPPGSTEQRRLAALLQRIAEYEPEAPEVGSSRRVEAGLERRIRDAARRAAERRPADDRHWAPLLGGDVGAHDAGHEGQT